MTADADVGSLSQAVATRLRALHIEMGAARALAERGQGLEAELALQVERKGVAERVAGVLAALATERDAAARAQVEALVTSGLQAIFGSEDGEQLSFHLVESTQRNTTNIDFVVRTTLPDGTTFDTDVLSARGGGLASVVGLLLRVVLILLTRQTGKPVSDVLVLDETLAMLSADRLEAASAFLRTLVDSTGLQIIMVTHQIALEDLADVVYRLRLDPNGVTVATRER